MYLDTYLQRVRKNLMIKCKAQIKTIDKFSEMKICIDHQQATCDINSGTQLAAFQAYLPEVLMFENQNHFEKFF